MKKRTTYLLIATLTLIIMSGLAFADQPIKGTVSYHNPEQTLLPSVTVGLYIPGPTEAEDVLIATTTTNILGKYIFPNIPSGTYVVKGSYTPIEPGGYDEIDRAMIANHIQAPFLNGIAFRAADLNHNQIVDAADLALFDLYWNTSFEPAWVFQPVTVSHDGTKTNVPTMSGSSSGDVNGTFVPTTRNEPFIDADYIQKNFSKNFTIEVYARDLNAASAMGIIIEYPSTINVKSVKSPLGELRNARIEENEVIVNWNSLNYIDRNINSNEPILIIYASTNENYASGDIKFNINSKTNFLKGGEVVSPKLSLTYLSVNGSDFLSHCYPNPANSTTTVYFTVPADSKTTIDIYNLSGQLVKSVLNEVMSQGNHSVQISLSDLKEGVYFCNLRTNGNDVNQTKRLVVVH